MNRLEIKNYDYDDDDDDNHADEVFAEALRTYARMSGKSINQTVKVLFVPILE